MTTNKINKERILVTGCGGLIGTRVQQALASNYQIVGLDIKEPEHSVEGAEFMKCDLTDDDSVRETLEAVRERFGARIASVVHLAAYYDFSGKPSPLYETLTVKGTQRLIHALQSFEVEQFVFSSTLLVMKPSETKQLTEEDPVRAEWAYPQSKLRTEKVLHEERGKIPVVILRLAGVYDEECHSLPVGQQICRIYEKQLESLFFPGNKTHGQALIHLDDVASCVHRVVEARKKLSPDETFLIAEPEVMSYADLQERLGQQLHGKAWPAIRIPKPLAKAGAWMEDKLPGKDAFIKPWMIDLADDNYAVELRHARERLHWQPEHRLSQTLQAMTDNLKNDPLHWYEVNGLPPPKELEEATAHA